jgi:ABC-type multidrug transport system permease subunit
LLFWLLIKRYLAATITCSVAIFLSSLLLYLFRESPVGLLSRLSENIIHITLLFGLSSAFIAREINHSDRWWIYGSALVPITLAVIASLYLNDRVLTVAIASIFYGLIFCGLCRFVYSRYDSRAIKADLSFYSALGICLITIILFRFWA